MSVVGLDGYNGTGAVKAEGYGVNIVFLLPL